MIESINRQLTRAGTKFINECFIDLNTDKMMENNKEFEINFWDLPDNIRLTLNKEFAMMLFDKCIELRALAKELGVSYPFACHLRKSMYSIPLNIILKLSDLSNVPLEDIQKNIISIRSRAGISSNVKFPIKQNEKIASLIGHVFGDGYVGRNKKQFEFSNNNPELIKEVKNQVYELFGILPITESQTRIGYPVIIGGILESFGAPIAPKIYSENLIPEWVMNSYRYNASFLKAFFDDDGSVMLSPNYRAKGLNLYVIRHINKKESLYKLLEQIKFVLKEFNIFAGEPKISRQYEKPDGMRVVMYINITDYRSLINFHDKIGLTNGKKFEKLKKIVNSKIFYSKGNERILNNKILEFLSRKECASTAEIADYTGKSKAKTIKKLKQLHDKNLVEIIGKVASNRSYIWKKLGGETKIE